VRRYTVLSRRDFENGETGEAEKGSIFPFAVSLFSGFIRAVLS
jgi:hypothetical protein